MNVSAEKIRSQRRSWHGDTPVATPGEAAALAIGVAAVVGAAGIAAAAGPADAGGGEADGAAPLEQALANQTSATAVSHLRPITGATRQRA